MQRMKWWLLCWLVFFLSHQPSACPRSTPVCKKKPRSQGQGFCKDKYTKSACPEPKKDCKTEHDKDNGCSSKQENGRGKCCMDLSDNILKNGSCNDAVKTIEELQQILEEEEINGTSSSMISDSVVALQYKPNGTFEGLDIYASNNQVSPGPPPPSSTVRVQLPSELKAGPNNKVVFCMIKWPETNQDEVYDGRLIGLSVQGKNISGLQQRVNITINFTKEINETQEPSCQFLNFSTNTFSEDGCITLRTRGQNNLTCSCDHLTYFAVLLVPVSDTNGTGSLSSKDQEILTYITLIGCSLSLFALVITVLLFITNRKVREDLSMKVHINLVIALILLNLHFLLTSTVAAVSSTGLCLYMALALHYSLLTTFSWMALEGFHLYLLLVKVFNIYIKRYLLKLSMVGWGVPAVIVSVVVIIGRSFYGLVSLDTSNSNNTHICYITDDKVKMGTTLGPFILVFLFNMIMFAVTIRRVWILRKSTEFGQSNRDRAKKDICTLLGVMTLLGITWGLVFFSFGYLTTAGVYLFCILNSLQGFFIFLWFMMSLRKPKTAVTKTSSETRSTNT
ncbi:adhesion G-protein coupled receptor G2-like [Oreochromis aureus]|uniref:adhesion G-protein coupled receptor G2-like n=1 Tax=Oreochromis aureus TaxID=47969 RepID=UPI001954B004|nr:adhesion G-protein coupled receptor G2-like [Oreochromis aureus]